MANVRWTQCDLKQTHVQHLWEDDERVYRCRGYRDNSLHGPTTPGHPDYLGEPPESSHGPENTDRHNEWERVKRINSLPDTETERSDGLCPTHGDMYDHNCRRCRDDIETILRDSHDDDADDTDNSPETPTLKSRGASLESAAPSPVRSGVPPTPIQDAIQEHFMMMLQDEETAAYETRTLVETLVALALVRYA